MFFLTSIVLFLTFFFILFSNSIILLWSGLLLNTMITIFILQSFKNELMFKYFMIQEISTMLFILFLLYEKFFFLSIIFLILKLGLPPFYFWKLELLLKSSKIQSLWLLTTSKLFPSILLMFFMIPKLFLPLLMFTYSEMLVFLNNKTFKSFLFFSSSSNLYMLLIFSLFFLKTAIFIFVFYLFITILTFTPATTMVWNKTNIFFMFNLLALPPFPFFFIKLFIFIMISKTLFIFFLVFLFFSSISFFISLNFLVIFMSSPNSFLKKNTFKSKSLLLMIFMSSIIIFMI